MPLTPTFPLKGGRLGWGVKGIIRVWMKQLWPVASERLPLQGKSWTIAALCAPALMARTYITFNSEF